MVFGASVREEISRGQIRKKNHPAGVPSSGSICRVFFFGGRLKAWGDGLCSGGKMSPNRTDGHYAIAGLLAGWKAFPGPILNMAEELAQRRRKPLEWNGWRPDECRKPPHGQCTTQYFLGPEIAQALRRKDPVDGPGFAEARAKLRLFTMPHLLIRTDRRDFLHTLTRSENPPPGVTIRPAQSSSPDEWAWVVRVDLRRTSGTAFALWILRKIRSIPGAHRIEIGGRPMPLQMPEAIDVIAEAVVNARRRSLAA
jgi:hypothetical protein